MKQNRKTTKALKSLGAPKRDVVKWIRGLRSGKYLKTRGTLQDSKGFCCLGVGCEVLTPNYVREDDSGFLHGTNPYYKNGAPRWLENINHHFAVLTGVHLVSLNDGGYHPFKREYFKDFQAIADCLEAVYLLGVLDD